jgi:glycosyltransferase involved in cell wall biosynthesis
MKILHVIPSLSPKDGGPSFALPLIARGLVQLGIEVDVVATVGKEETVAPDAWLNNDEDAAQVMRGGAGYLHFRRQSEFYKVSFPLTKWLSAHIRDYDLVHIHALFSYSSYAAAHIAGKNGVPYIIRPLGVLNRWGLRNRRRFMKQVSLRLIEKRIVRNAAAVHYTSEQERLEAEETVANNESAVIPLAVDLPEPADFPGPERFYELFPIARDREIILFLSRLNPKKGLDLLLRAFAEMTLQRPEENRADFSSRMKADRGQQKTITELLPSSSTITATAGVGRSPVNGNPAISSGYSTSFSGYTHPLLAIVGNGDEKFVLGLKQHAVELGIENKVLWAGFLEADDKLSAMAAAALFVLPSYSENFGIAPVEAMAAGLPAVISDQVGISAEALEYDAGLVVPCDVEAISSAMTRLLYDPGLRSRLSGNARKLVNERFSLGAMSNSVVMLYEQVLSRVAQPRARKGFC